MSTLSRRDLFRGTAVVGATALLKPGVGRAEPTAPNLVTTVNGDPVDTPIDDHETALDLVRDRLGLTGSKEACGHGACGACTMLVDGVPLVSCIQPASHLHGKRVVTIEGLHNAAGPRPTRAPGRPPLGIAPPPAPSMESLHPVQRAFLAEDALQCGYCTPGFVLEASVYHDTWRSTHAPGGGPTRAQVAAALSGHLCRCGAYEGIFRAVQGACKGDFDAVEPGEPPRIDGLEKVTGHARYTVDVSVPGMKEVVFVRSPCGGAKLGSIDDAAARKLDGVRTVLHLADSGATLRHAGQAVAMVVADDRPTARAAARMVRVAVTRGPVACDIASALAPGAPLVYPNRRKTEISSEMPVIPTAWNGNERGPLRTDIGLAPGRAQRAVERPSAAGVWSTQAQCHTALEPHACAAHWEGDSVTVWASTQMVVGLAEELADRLGLPASRVRVLAPYVGGAFGAKAAWDAHIGFVVDAARQLGVPLRYVPDRHEELLLGGYRPPQELKVAVAVSAGGELDGVSMEARGDSGVAVGANVGGIMRLRYPGAPKFLADYDVLTHAPAARPFRGPGGPPGYFALEGAIDQVAADRGVSPIALRRPWDREPAFHRLYDWAEALPEASRYADVGKDTGRFRDGVGIATAAWYHFVAPGTEVLLKADASGFHVSTASQDMGNGTRTALAQAVEDALGVPRSSVSVRVGDSRDVPGPMSAGSRTTVSVRPAVFDAARELTAAMLDFAVSTWGLVDAVVAPGGVQHAAGFARWATILEAGRSFSAIGRRKVDPAGWAIPVVIAGSAIGKHSSAALQVSLVRVDTWLGRVQVLKVWAGFAVGRVHSPVIARSQAIGGVIQSLGYALHEERRLDAKTGALLTHTLEDYHLPGIAEAPEIDVHFDDVPIPGVAAEGIGLSEVTTCGGGASIANAIFRATGWRPKELPARPDRVLAGLKAGVPA